MKWYTSNNVSVISRHVVSTAGSQDCSVRLWEVSTGRCMRTLQFEFPIRDVAWNPNSSYSAVAVAAYVSIVFDLFVLYAV